MNILKRFRKTENVKKVSPSKKKNTGTNFVDAQILVARARAYAVVYGSNKKDS
jgi:hypothetical protein